MSLCKLKKCLLYENVKSYPWNNDMTKIASNKYTYHRYSIVKLLCNAEFDNRPRNTMLTNN